METGSPSTEEGEPGEKGVNLGACKSPCNRGLRRCKSNLSQKTKGGGGGSGGAENFQSSAGAKNTRCLPSTLGDPTRQGGKGTWPRS